MFHDGVVSKSPGLAPTMARTHCPAIPVLWSLPKEWGLEGFGHLGGTKSSVLVGEGKRPKWWNFLGRGSRSLRSRETWKGKEMFTVQGVLSHPGSE